MIIARIPGDLSGGREQASAMLIWYWAVFVVAVCHARTVVLLTGCSSGIGKAIAHRLAANAEFKVWATMRSVEKWSYPYEMPNNLMLEQLDVTNEKDIQRVVERIISTDGAIDVLINNAGYGMMGGLEGSTINEGKVWSPSITKCFLLPCYVGYV